LRRLEKSYNIIFAQREQTRAIGRPLDSLEEVALLALRCIELLRVRAAEQMKQAAWREMNRRDRDCWRS
jgi:hypothetical protein